MLAILPVLAAVLGIGLALGAAGCTLNRMGTRPVEEEPNGGSGGTGNAGGTGGSGAVAGGGGEGGTGNAGGTGGAGGEEPIAPVATYYSPAPCIDPPSMSYDAGSNSLYMTCGANSTPPNALFKSPPLGQGGAWTNQGEVNGTPRNHIHLGDKYWLVTHSDPHGFTILDVNTATVTDSVDFSAISPIDPTYDFIKPTINNPTGAAIAGALVCMATANQDQPEPNPTFHDGSIICTQYNFDGTVYVPATKALLTNGTNPTGVTLLSDGRIAVVGSNTSADGPSTEAMVDVCTVPGGPCTPTSLGQVHAQTIPNVAQTTDGAFLLVGIQKPDPSKGFTKVDWANSSATIPIGLNIQGSVAAANSAKPSHELALIGSSGQYDVINGALFIYNLDQNGWSGTLETAFPGEAGPAVVVNDEYYAAITVNDGGNPAGQIYRADLSGL